MLEERNYYKVAIYIRLSREDADKGFDESESIVNQRHLLTEYVEKNSINDIILQKINDKKRVAIIVRSMNDLENIIPINSEYSFYNTISQVKGIEFDSVIVFERNMTNSEKYIAYTRALNELYIIKENAQIDNNYI